MEEEKSIYERRMDEIKKEIQSSEKLIELWKNVGFTYKKNGDEFVNLRKAITNAVVTPHSWDKDRLKITVSNTEEGKDYVFDSIAVYKDYGYSTVQKLINERISSEENRIANLKKDMADIESVSDLYEQTEDIVKTIETRFDGNTMLINEIEDDLQKIIRYFWRG